LVFDVKIVDFEIACLARLQKSIDKNK
jgi:hypothetical protein